MQHSGQNTRGQVPCRSVRRTGSLTGRVVKWSDVDRVESAVEGEDGRARSTVSGVGVVRGCFGGRWPPGQDAAGGAGDSAIAVCGALPALRKSPATASQSSLPAAMSFCRRRGARPRSPSDGFQARRSCVLAFSTAARPWRGRPSEGAEAAAHVEDVAGLDNGLSLPRSNHRAGGSMCRPCRCRRRFLRARSCARPTDHSGETAADGRRAPCATVSASDLPHCRIR